VSRSWEVKLVLLPSIGLKSKVVSGGKYEVKVKTKRVETKRDNLKLKVS